MVDNNEPEKEQMTPADYRSHDDNEYLRSDDEEEVPYEKLMLEPLDGEARPHSKDEKGVIMKSPQNHNAGRSLVLLAGRLLGCDSS